jgi:uncharacterized protein YaaW (UPF0174 family)
MTNDNKLVDPLKINSYNVVGKHLERGSGGKTLDELKSALLLATEEELQQLTNILFCRSFNPLDYWQIPEPNQIQSQDRDSWLTSLESRFRYLAADGLTVLRRKTEQVSYRQVLIQVCRYLKIPYANSMSTLDIEAEIFLNLLQKAWQRLSKSEQQSIRDKVVQSLANTPSPEPLPLKLQHDPLKILLRGSGVLAVGSILKPWLLKKIAQQFALHFARYQIAKTAILKGGVAAAAQGQNQLALQAAKKGMAMTAARYGAIRGVFAFLGPVLWGCFLAELGWRAIATNYTRIIPVIFTLAQIRLTRSESWQPA